MAFEKYQMPEGSVYSSTMNSKDGWLDPLVVSPRDTHSRSFIILHGRGSNAFSFGSELLTTKLPSSSLTLPELFPGARFILPTSRLRRSTMYQRVKISQWFDIESIVTPDQRQELQHEGLHDSATFIHEIIRQEAALVGTENVILGGLSQGCVAGLHVMLSLRCTPGQSLGGFFGMSGWLPFATQLDAISEEKDPALMNTDGVPQEIDDNPFDHNITHNNVSTSMSAQAAHFVRRGVMNFPDSDSDNHTSSVPIFLGHGELDQKVPLCLGTRASTIMAKLGWEVTWKPYANLGHWYCGEELDDIATFVGSLERIHGIK
jgi:predicted esterase